MSSSRGLRSRPRGQHHRRQFYAAEGQVFVLAPCAIVGDAAIELFCDTPVKEQLLQRGGGFARIYGPDGRPLAEPLPEDAEGILYADIDLSAIPFAKAAADPVGHYSSRRHPPLPQPHRTTARGVHRAPG